jgi:hypothetical protein
MTKKDWTEQLRERLADYEADAPEGLWADIERRLTQQPTSVVVPPQQKSTVTPLWRRWVSIAALVALVAGMGWWFWPKEQTANGPLAKKEQTQSKPLAKQEPELRESPVRTGRTESSLTTEKKYALIKQITTSYPKIIPLLTTKQKQSGLRFPLSLNAPLSNSPLRLLRRVRGLRFPLSLSAPLPSPRLLKTARASR